MHLIDVTMFFSPRSGGVKRYLLSKREWLARNAPSVRHSLLVPAPRRAASGLYICDGAALSLADGYRLPLDLFKWQSTLAALQPDLIEAADPYVPGWAARRCAARLQIPCVAFYHSHMPGMLAERLGSWIAPLARSYLRQLYRGFDLVVAPSRIMRDHLDGAGIRNVAVQALGVDLATFNPAAGDARLRARLNVNRNTRLLVYAGRFSKEKKLEVLIEAVERLGDPYHLVLIGGRRRRRIASRVTMLPYQRSSERLARLLASCDVFVHAGEQETYGLVAAEAMGCGLPVVGIARSAIPELVDDSVGMLAVRADASLIAGAVHGIFDRDMLSLKLAARERAVTRHNWDTVFRNMLSHYTHMVSPSIVVPQRLALQQLTR